MWIILLLGGGDSSAAIASVEALRGDRSSAVLLWRGLLRHIFLVFCLSAAPMASTDAPSTRGRRGPSRVVRASRPLLRRAGAWSFPTRAFFLVFACRPRRRRRVGCIACGFFRAFVTKKSSFWVPWPATTRRNDSEEADFVAASHDACETDRDSPLHAIAAETAAHTRRKKSARDEGRATQRSNG